ncbi:hypothetical protein NUV33_00220 [Micrococcus luteus]|uniref:hypothetical protein n=1 Tax=Micrococcus luteus TaxID=1270 RepID=UPI00214F95AD|nr:hypothetical protein [Micrococcus luteus]MCR4487538.1 hypothetical protein [Micrococcus luteus]
MSTSIIVRASDTTVLGADLFTSINNLIAKAQGTFNLLVILLGAVIFLIGSARGKWTVPAVLLSLLAAALFVWGGLQGVQWAADSAGATIK